MFSFENFPVYKKSEEFYSLLIQILSRKDVDKNIKDQFRRAALSIVLNIAEGSGKFTKNDKKNFYVIAKGSTNECVALLRILRIENSISQELFEKSYGYLLEIAKMLSGLISAMIRRA